MSEKVRLSQAVAEFSESLRLDPNSSEAQQDVHTAEEQEGQISSSNDNHF